MIWLQRVLQLIDAHSRHNKDICNAVIRVIICLIGAYAIKLLIKCENPVFIITLKLSQKILKFPASCNYKALLATNIIVMIYNAEIRIRNELRLRDMRLSRSNSFRATLPQLRAESRLIEYIRRVSPDIST